MAIECLSGESFRGQVGNPLAEDVVFQVTDANGAPLKGKHVCLTADPPGSVSFGGDRQAVVETKADGTVAVKMMPRSFGTHGVMATVAGATGRETTTIEVDGFHPEVEVRDMNGRIVALRRAPQPVPPQNYAWPVVLGVAAILAAVLIWKVIDKPSAAPAPVVVAAPATAPAAPVDNDARSKAIAALKAVDDARRDLTENITAGLTANSTHDRGYAHELVERGPMRLLRPLIAADNIYETICRADPDLPSCR